MSAVRQSEAGILPPGQRAARVLQPISIRYSSQPGCEQTPRVKTTAAIVAVRELLHSGQILLPGYSKRCKTCSLEEICRQSCSENGMGLKDVQRGRLELKPNLILNIYYLQKV